MRLSELQAPVVNDSHTRPLRREQNRSAPAPRSAATDRADLSTPPPNPFEGVSNRAVKVTVDPWKKGDNDSIDHILQKQGFTLDEIYRRDPGGRTLVERVAEVNGLRDPNLLKPRSPLLVPTKEKAGPPADEEVRVKVDPWRRGPNDSLERILRNQGYDSREIYRKDAAGKTLVDRVAERNGVQNPARLRSGQELSLPRRGTAEKPAAAATPRRPEAPAEKPPIAEAPRPTEAPAGKPLAAETTPEPAGEATVEMGLLLDGIRQKRLTREEFQALNSAANQYTELRARSGRDGFTPEELRGLGHVERQYGEMYARFWEHDRSKIRFEGTESQDEATRSRVTQNEESGSLFDQFVGGQLDSEEFVTRLMAQRESARRLGSKP